eukprot:599016-Pyramimonas_sp.AAC.1
MLRARPCSTSVPSCNVSSCFKVWVWANSASISSSAVVGTRTTSLEATRSARKPRNDSGAPREIQRHQIIGSQPRRLRAPPGRLFAYETSRRHAPERGPPQLVPNFNDL